MIPGAGSEARADRTVQRAPFRKRVQGLALSLAVPAALTFPTVLIVSRALGPTDKGAWSVLVQYLFLLEQVTALGGGAYVAVRIAEGHSPRELRRVLVGVPTLVPAVAIVILAMTGLLLHIPSSTFDDVVPYFALTLPLLVLGRLLNHVYVGAGKTAVVFWSQTVQSGVLFGGTATLALVDKLTLASALWLFALSVAMRALIPIMALPTLRIYGQGLGSVPSTSDYVRFGSRRMITDVEDSVNTRLPLLLVAQSHSLGDTGVYSVSLGLAEVLAQGGMAVSMAMYSETNADSERRAMLVRVSTATAALIAMLGVVAAPLIPFAFGSSFRGAVGEFLWLLPVIPLLTLNRAMASIFAAGNRTALPAASGIVSLVAILIGTVAFTDVFGVTGATLALILGLTLQATILVVAGSRWLGVACGRFILPSQADFSQLVRVLRTLAVSR